MWEVFGSSRLACSSAGAVDAADAVGTATSALASDDSSALASDSDVDGPGAEPDAGIASSASAFSRSSGNRAAECKSEVGL